jgi:hypothetical protein
MIAYIGTIEAFDTALVINDLPAICLSPDNIFLQVLSILLKYEGGCQFFPPFKLNHEATVKESSTVFALKYCPSLF